MKSNLLAFLALLALAACANNPPASYYAPGAGVSRGPTIAEGVTMSEPDSPHSTRRLGRSGGGRK